MTQLQCHSVLAGIDAKHPIVGGVSFTAAPHTMTAIVGVNGVGKSTLLRSLAGITRPLGGTVELQLDGASAPVDVHGLKPKARAKLMTLVGQEESPPGDLTVAEAVQLGRLPHLKSWQIGGKRERAIVEEALELVGMSHVADQPTAQLSGGQRRRVMLARGFAQGTDLIVLDEPTNHLDVHHQLHLLKVLRESGRTIVATIHDLDLAMAHFDHVVVLHKQPNDDVAGVLATGHPHDVLIPETIRETFDVRALVAQPEGACSPHVLIDSL